MSQRNYTAVRKAAIRYWKSGLSVSPIGIGGDKKPYSALLPGENGESGWAVLAEAGE